jgi:hypothetical protein
VTFRSAHPSSFAMTDRGDDWVSRIESHLLLRVGIMKADKTSSPGCSSLRADVEELKAFATLVGCECDKELGYKNKSKEGPTSFVICCCQGQIKTNQNSVVRWRPAGTVT